MSEIQRYDYDSCYKFIPDMEGKYVTYTDHAAAIAAKDAEMARIQKELANANRGAEKNARIVMSQAEKINAKDAEIEKAAKVIVAGNELVAAGEKLIMEQDSMIKFITSELDRAKAESVKDAMDQFADHEEALKDKDAKIEALRERLQQEQNGSIVHSQIASDEAKEMCDEIDTLRAELEREKERIDWFVRRFDELTMVQKHKPFRDPERTMVCDVLANGKLDQTMEAEGRYDIPPCHGCAELERVKKMMEKEIERVRQNTQCELKLADEHIERMEQELERVKAERDGMQRVAGEAMDECNEWGNPYIVQDKLRQIAGPDPLPPCPGCAEKERIAREVLGQKWAREENIYDSRGPFYCALRSIVGEANK